MKILRISEVRKITGLGRSTLYDMISAGCFPRQVRIGKRAVGWLEPEIETWVGSKVSERDSVGA